MRAAFKSTIDGGSFHYVSQFTSQGVTQTTNGDAGPASGKQVITIGSDTFTVLVVGPACYFQGNARQMVDQLGLPTALATAPRRPVDLARSWRPAVPVRVRGGHHPLGPGVPTSPSRPATSRGTVETGRVPGARASPAR